MDHGRNLLSRARSAAAAALLLALLPLLLGAAGACADGSLLWGHKSGGLADPLPVDQAFELVSAERADGVVKVGWSIAPGYYLYRARLGFEVSPAGRGHPLAAVLPAGLHIEDERGPSEIYRGNLVATLKAVDPSAKQLRIRYQGCADAGLCYPPQTRILDIVPAASAH